VAVSAAPIAGASAVAAIGLIGDLVDAGISYKMNNRDRQVTAKRHSAAEASSRR
jgi:hypothetical protein